MRMVSIFMFSKFHCHIAPHILRKAVQLLFHDGANHRFQFEKRSQLFIRVRNETLSVAAMALCHEETVQRTARGQDSRGLTLARCYEISTASINRLSAPVECSQFVAKEF